MDIIIRKRYKTIIPFELKDLPDLVVLTGENGTGKTQLLEYLYYRSRLNDKGEEGSLTDEHDNYIEMPEPESEQGPLGL